MLEAIDKIKDLDIKTICPGHGPILRSNWQNMQTGLKKMAEDTEERAEKHKVFMPYVSAYGNTGKQEKDKQKV